MSLWRQTPFPQQQSQHEISATLPQISYQIAYPVSDTSVGAWTNEVGTTTNLWASLNEVSPVDATYVTSEISPVNSQYVAQLGPQPGSAAGIITLKFRHANSAVTGGTINYTYDIMQGVSIVQTFGPYAVSTNIVAEIDATVTNAITDLATPFLLRVTANQIA